PDAGVAVDRDERGAARAGRALVGVLEQLELGLTADERGREAADRRAELGDADGAVGRHGVAPAAQLERADLLQLDAVSEEPCRRRADEDLVRRSLGLEARS